VFDYADLTYCAALYCMLQLFIKEFHDDDNNDAYMRTGETLRCCWRSSGRGCGRWCPASHLQSSWTAHRCRHTTTRPGDCSSWPWYWYWCWADTDGCDTWWTMMTLTPWHAVGLPMT